MKKEQMHIGLALSGGGMRATIYHLDVPRHLTQQGFMGRASHTSIVPGANICIGLICTCNVNQWPSNIQFLERVLPAVKECITQKDIQWHALLRLFSQSCYWDKKADLLVRVMEQHWAVEGCLQGIAGYSVWTINATACELGRDLRFSSTRMGERDSGYVMHPSFALSHTVAASTGFPVLIGPYKLKTDKCIWTDVTEAITVRPRNRVLHLWGGGVHDNMGLDPPFTTEQGGDLHRNINCLIISNASGNIEHKTRKYSLSIENLKHLLDINMNQVELLRSQEAVDSLREYHNGAYLKIDTTVKEIMQHCTLSEEQRDAWICNSMKEAEVQRVTDYKTTLEKVSVSDYDAASQRGYEIAKAPPPCFRNIA